MNNKIIGKSFTTEDRQTQFYISFVTGNAWTRKRNAEGEWLDWELLNISGAFFNEGEPNVNSK